MIERLWSSWSSNVVPFTTPFTTVNLNRRKRAPWSRVHRRAHQSCRGTPARMGAAKTGLRVIACSSNYHHNYCLRSLSCLWCTNTYTGEPLNVWTNFQLLKLHQAELAHEKTFAHDKIRFSSYAILKLSGWLLPKITAACDKNSSNFGHFAIFSSA